MKETVDFLAQHGYWLLFAAVLGRQACLPVPANLLLVAAGALARSGKLSFPGIVGLAVTAFVLADLAWYEAGRRWGYRTLHFLCGLARNPGACAGKATTAFAKHGVRTLLISKFVMGLDAVAVPLTGAGGIPLPKFVLFDGVGAMFWSSSYATIGYLFSEQLDRVALHVARIGALAGLLALAVCGFYAGKKIARWVEFVRQFTLARITPQELKEKLDAHDDILVVDLQGHSAAAAVRMAIPGAVRIDPWKLELYRDVEIPASKDVVLYCTSPGELLSARVALALRKRGVVRVRPLAGGFKGWRKLGFPVTAEVGVPASSAIRA